MTDECISPLRRRMIEDMTVRNFAAKTQHDYVQRVKSFAAFLGARPTRLSRKTCAAFGCIWRRAARVRQRSTPPSRRCGSSSM